MRTTLVVFFSLAPVLIVIIQQRTIYRQSQSLKTLPTSCQDLALWKSANAYLNRRTLRIAGDTSNFDFNYLFIIALFTFVLFMSWDFSVNAPFENKFWITDKNPLLLGPFVPAKNLQSFQENTLFVSIIAFVVSYARVISRMAVRINVGEFGATYHLFDLISILSAIIVSVVGRILIAQISTHDEFAVYLAVVAGLRPDLWLAALGRAGTAVLSARGSPFASMLTPERNPLAEGELPPEVQMQAVDGIDYEMEQRLRQVDIQSTHKLAFQNPFVIWVRSTFSIQEISDWLGQVLVLLYFPTAIHALRGKGIRTISDLLFRLEHDAPGVAAAAGLDESSADAVRAMLLQVPQVRNSLELCEALRQGK